MIVAAAKSGNPDLFQRGLERLPVPDAQVYVQRNFPASVSAEIALKRLMEETPWRSDAIKLWGKTFAQPRLTAWYGDPGRVYTYSGITLIPENWTPLLLALKSDVEHAVAERFNSVLLNYYRTGRDSVGYHSDDEEELGRTPTIASLSFGATRTFVFKSKQERHKPVRITLEDGTLLLMKGTTQQNWRHAIGKETKPCGPRVNLTFRKIISG